MGSQAEKNHQIYQRFFIKAINFLDEQSICEILELFPVPDGEVLKQADVAKILFRCGTYLNELVLSKICDSRIMTVISIGCKNLTKLEVILNQRLQVKTRDYIEAFQQLHKLKYIKIKSSPLGSHEETKMDYTMLNHLPLGINEIHVIHPKVRTEARAYFNLNQFKNLHSLTLSGCNLDCILSKISQQVQLVYLHLKNSWATENCIFADTFLFQKLVKLEHFHCFSNWEHITQRSPTSLFNTCRNIKYFNGPTGDSCEILPQNWINLQKLENFTINWIYNKDLTLNILANCSTNVKSLHFTHKTDINFLFRLAEFQHLEHLDYPLKDNTNRDVLLAIAARCKKIKHLGTYYDDDDYDLDDLDVFNDKALYEFDDSSHEAIANTDFLIKNHDKIYYCDPNYRYPDDIDNSIPCTPVFHEISRMKNLEYLNMAQVENFQDQDMIKIASRCRNLEYLNISKCKYITEIGLNAITTMPSLRRLNISNIKCVTNTFLNKLKGLTSLVCDGCKAPTNHGFFQVIKNCPDLKYLSLRHTRMTYSIIIDADAATQGRENNTVLHIHCSIPQVKHFCRDLVRSRWLVISCLIDDKKLVQETFNMQNI